MAVDVKTVTQAAREYVSEVRRVLPVDRAVLFGSYAKGTASEHSDVDIGFFIHDMNGRRRVDIVAELLGIGQKYYKVASFEPAVFPTSEIDNNNPFVNEVLRTGREIV